MNLRRLSLTLCHVISAKCNHRFCDVTSPYVIYRVTMTSFLCQLAFAAILWVKLLRNVCHCNISEIRFVGKLVIIQTF